MPATWNAPDVCDKLTRRRLVSPCLILARLTPTNVIRMLYVRNTNQNQSQKRPQPKHRFSQGIIQKPLISRAIRAPQQRSPSWSGVAGGTRPEGAVRPPPAYPGLRPNAGVIPQPVFATPRKLAHYPQPCTSLTSPQISQSSQSSTSQLNRPTYCIR